MSERQEQRRIERSGGTGMVTRDGVALGSATYVMEVWQTFHVFRTFGPGPKQEVAGMKDINIRFVNHELDSFKLWKESATLTLHLEDGRRLDGFLNGDEFVASGQLTTA
jgi:hypothetical protein